MAIKNRKSAGDLFRDSNLIFGKKVGFDEAFPQIEDLEVVVEELGNKTFGRTPASCYTKQSFPGEYINCGNRLCYGGGFSIGAILHDMVQNNQRDLETIQYCMGNEASHGGRRIYRKCMNSFKIHVVIIYKANKEKID